MPSQEFLKPGPDPTMNKSREKMLSFYTIKDKDEDILALLQEHERKYHLIQKSHQREILKAS